MCHSLGNRSPTGHKSEALSVPLPRPTQCWQVHHPLLASGHWTNSKTYTTSDIGRNYNTCNKGKLPWISPLQSTKHLEKLLKKTHLHYPSNINKQLLWLVEETCALGYGKLCGSYSHGQVQFPEDTGYGLEEFDKSHSKDFPLTYYITAINFPTPLQRV